MEYTTRAIDFTRILPNEVTFNICNNLNRSTLLTCVRVNRYLRAVCMYLIEHKRKIRLVDDNLGVIFVAPTTSGKTSLVRHLACRKFYPETPEQRLSSGRHTFIYDVYETTRSARGRIQTITFFDPPTAFTKPHLSQTWIYAWRADVCVLVLDGFTNNNADSGTSFKASEISELVTGVCHMMSSRDVIVAINLNQDDTNAEKRFNTMRSEVSKVLNKVIGPCFDVIPVDSLNKTNLLKDGPVFPWYRGLNLINLLRQNRIETDSDEKKIAQLRQQPFEFQLYEKYRIPGISTIAVGRVMSGSVKPGDIINLIPYYGAKTEVKSIELRHKAVEKAEAGDFVGIAVKNTFQQVKKKFGFMTGSVPADVKIDIAMALRVKLVILKSDRMTLHNCYKVHYGGSRLLCMLWWVFPEENYQKRQDLKKLKKATAILLPLARIPMRVYKPTVFQKNSHGKVMMCQRIGTNGRIVAIGRIDKVIARQMKVTDIRQPRTTDFADQYNLVIKRAAELFTAEEYAVQEQFVAHVTTDSGAKTVTQFVKRIHEGLGKAE